MKAKHDGWCQACGEQFWQDEDIEFSGNWDGWVHASCKDDDYE